MTMEEVLRPDDPGEQWLEEVAELDEDQAPPWDEEGALGLCAALLGAVGHELMRAERLAQAPYNQLTSAFEMLVDKARVLRNDLAEHSVEDQHDEEHIIITPIDYRVAIAPLAPRPVGDCQPPGA